MDCGVLFSGICKSGRCFSIWFDSYQSKSVGKWSKLLGSKLLAISFGIPSLLDADSHGVVTIYKVKRAFCLLLRILVFGWRTTSRKFLWSHCNQAELSVPSRYQVMLLWIIRENENNVEKRTGRSSRQRNAWVVRAALGRRVGEADGKHTQGCLTFTTGCYNPQGEGSSALVKRCRQGHVGLLFYLLELSWQSLCVVGSGNNMATWGIFPPLQMS